MSVTFNFASPLPDLLRSPHKGKPQVNHPLQRRASIKDVIESFGIPHTEIAHLYVNSQEVDFHYIPHQGDIVKVEAIRPPFDVLTPSLLRPNPLPEIRFAVDANVGKLARLLRMAGFDTFYAPHLDDGALAHIVEKEQRILLTRDTNLLKRKKILFGHLIRDHEPKKQFHGILHLFGIITKTKPFSRCFLCNTPLEKIDKERIIERLEPLTKKYYNTFRHCPACDKIYWAGSHKDKMMTYFEHIADMWTSGKEQGAVR